MKQSFIISLIFVLILFVSCIENTTQKNEEQTDGIFEFPKLDGNTGNGVYIDTVKQLGLSRYPLEKNSISKNIIQLFDLQYSDNSFQLIQGSLQFSTTNDLGLYVDASQELTIKYKDDYIPPPHTFDESRNIIDEYHCPYDSIKAFPAYIINFTDSIQGVQNHDGKIVVIQEALNTENEWKPIEYFSNSGCSYSNGITILDTNSYLIFGVHKYKGDFKTKLRLRLNTNGNIIISNEYIGYVNKSQIVEGENSFGRSYLK